MAARPLSLGDNRLIRVPTVAVNDDQMIQSLHQASRMVTSLGDRARLLNPLEGLVRINLNTTGARAMPGEELRFGGLAIEGRRRLIVLGVV